MTVTVDREGKAKIEAQGQRLANERETLMFWINQVCVCVDASVSVRVAQVWCDDVWCRI